MCRVRGWREVERFGAIHAILISAPHNPYNPYRSVAVPTRKQTMAALYDFFITDTVDASKQVIDAALRSQGFDLASTPEGGLVASRGSTAMTVLFGAMAGKKMHMSFDVQFFVDEQGRTVARLIRNLAAGALKGGAIGASRTAQEFQTTAGAIEQALVSAGILATVTEG